MSERLSLKLISEDSGELLLNLHEENMVYSLEAVLSSSQKIFSDQKYNMEILGFALEDIQDVHIRINDENIDSAYMNGQIVLHDYPFRDILGFVQVVVIIIYQDGNKKGYSSDYASIMVKENYQTENAMKMLQYIYDNNIEFLYKSFERSEVSEAVSNASFEDLLSRISMLEKIVQVYEHSYGYFKANSRYKLQAVYSVERIEKIQSVGARTLQYMVQHPEYMRRQYTGIRHGRQYYLPEKTLMSINQITTDIYENQIVVGFLERVLGDTEILRRDIQHYLSLIDKEDTEEGYILSSYLIYLNTFNKLMNAQQHLDLLCSKLQELFIQYKQTLQVSEISTQNPPKPTQIFLSEPQYNRIFLYITNWYSNHGFDFGIEQLMVYFYNSSRIFEYYTLIKLVETIRDYGFEMLSSKKTVYPNTYTAFGMGDHYNNVFIFTRDSATITVYYEPVIYDSDKRNIADLELYRNNSVSFREEDSVYGAGKYYTPDYVLKYKDGNIVRYIICDAKYSTLNTVRYKYIPILAYKYLFSISAVPVEDIDISILGLAVFYGKSSGLEEIKSFYDRSLGENITPFIYMIPISEKMNEDNRKNVLQELVKALCTGL